MPEFEESDGFEEEQQALEKRNAQRVSDAAARGAKLAAIRRVTSSDAVDFDEDDQLDQQAMEDAEKKVAQLKAQRAAMREADEKVANFVRHGSADLVTRAKALFSHDAFGFPSHGLKKVRDGDRFVTQAKPTDENIFIVLNVLFDEEEMPHNNEFIGRLVDHEGKVIDKSYHVVDWVTVFAAAGIHDLTARRVRECLVEFAMKRSYNDLIVRLSKLIPDWDGVPRMRNKLISLFDCNDTPLNQDFGEYFWLALYARMMMPGELAPMVLSLFGVQNCGKSYFGKRLCQIITGNEGADSTQLNLDAQPIDFLREITGQSVIASVGEMTGFGRGDLNRIKDFITRTSDKMHYKFEAHFTQLRQWITIMDGNKYEGLQRDPTGNRRFYPMFCGQLPDQDGQPRWSETFKADFTNFEEDVWQLLAEAKDWFDREGVNNYKKLVDDVSNKVKKFSQYEMDNMRGTAANSVMAQNFTHVLREALDCTEAKDYKSKNSRYYAGGKCAPGVAVSSALLGQIYREKVEAQGANYGHLLSFAKIYGAAAVELKGGQTFFVFPGFDSVDAMRDCMDGDEGLKRVEVVRSSAESPHAF